ncbi:MAG: hypothetical protein LBP67_00005, partial [Bacteroidales bacterium]|nr:hypothetical protein [Bacteroidales bacterium]
FGLVNTIHGDIVDRYNTAIPQYIEYVVKNDSINIKNYFYEEHEWGRYIICNDTLKMQWIQRPMNLNDYPWISFEIWYKIIDKNTLERIYTRPIFKQQSDIDTYYNYTQLTFKYEPAKFIATSVLPSSDGWIKKQKWFWKNESDWKEYMKQFKNK